MKKKSYYLFGLLSSISILLFSIALYLNIYKSMSKIEYENKNQFVKLTSLPDLALSTQSSYIRHRSLTDLFSIYSNDGVLREYDITSFTYSLPNINHSKSSKVISEK